MHIVFSTMHCVSTGAVGCSALSLILPCMIHLKLRRHTRPQVILNVLIITFAVVASILAVIEVLLTLIRGGKTDSA